MGRGPAALGYGGRHTILDKSKSTKFLLPNRRPSFKRRHRCSIIALPSPPQHPLRTINIIILVLTSDTTGFIDSVESAKGNGTIKVPPHVLVTHYLYNSLNEVTTQTTPDASTSHFWYDILGRLAVSQNAQQSIDGKYSYTLYDPLGRITEVGQEPQSTVMTQTISQDTTLLKSWINTNTREQLTATVYDIGAGTGGDLTTELMTQNNLRNRVSYTYTKNLSTDVNFYQATYYTYDIHGNVDTLVQDYLGIASLGLNHYRRICYDYDLISGKVNGVDYQPGVGYGDTYYHRYFYDAENRITEVLTSRDSVVWESDAKYSYYKHGPLSRTILGKMEVQGLDYSYTLQGWLKGVNMGGGTASVDSTGYGTGNSGETCPTGTGLENTVVTTRDVSDPPDYYALNSITFTGEFASNTGDAFETVINPALGTCTITGSGTGFGSSGAPEVYPIAQDVYNYSLHYYPGDYQPIGSTVIVPAVLEAIPAQAAPLYNGNIAAMSVNIPKLGVPKVYNYHYDQLNRLGQMDTYNGLNNGTGVFTPVQLSDYLERASYDPNGNILTYQRNGVLGTGTPLAMDNLSYTYNANTNQLQRINDTVSSSNYSTDIDDQGTGTNYTYDAIGNLKTDVAASLSGITWTVYGKIASITNSSGTITYTYDAAGNRITKTVGDTLTLYVRDAQGNVMSVYKQGGSGMVQQIESHLYGSSRLGLAGVLTTPPTTVMMGSGTGYLGTFTRGEKIFELTNHLGNVLATVSDKKIAVSSTGNSSLIDHYTADLVTAQDYYPFGMEMPGRSFSSVNYRYGFNGKENDNEVKGVGDQIDYGMRVYDPRIGKFLSVDPITKKYPELTPYQFASNRPIDGADLDGLEWDLRTSAPKALKETGYLIHDNHVREMKKWQEYALLAMKRETTIAPARLPSGPYQQQLWQENNIKNFQDLTYNDDGSKPFLMRVAENRTWANFSENIALPMIEGYLYLDGFAEFQSLKGLYKGELFTEGAKVIDREAIFSNSIETRGLAEKYAVTTNDYKGFQNANELIKPNNPIYDLFDKTGNVVDITTTSAKKLSPSQFYKKLTNLGGLDQNFNNRILQIYIKDGQYTTEEVGALKQKLNNYIKDYSLPKTSVEVTTIK